MLSTRVPLSFIHWQHQTERILEVKWGRNAEATGDGSLEPYVHIEFSFAVGILTPVHLFDCKGSSQNWPLLCQVWHLTLLIHCALNVYVFVMLYLSRKQLWRFWRCARESAMQHCRRNLLRFWRTCFYHRRRWLKSRLSGWLNTDTCAVMKTISTSLFIWHDRGVLWLQLLVD